MGVKLSLKARYLDFNLSTPLEIGITLGSRLKSQRLIKNMKQKDLAARAGVSLATVKKLESKGKSSLNTWIRVVFALGLIQELQELFEFKFQSIAELEKIERLKSAKIPKRAR